MKNELSEQSDQSVEHIKNKSTLHKRRPSKETSISKG